MLVPGVVGLSIMFQGIQAVAMQLAQEFGFTHEIEDRVQAPCPIWLVAISKVISGGAQTSSPRRSSSPSRPWSTPRGGGPDRAALVVHPDHRPAVLRLHASLGLLLGTSFEPRNLGLMFGFIVLRSPSSVARTTNGPGWRRSTRVFHWLQIVVLVNPLICINDGMRAAFTDAAHMHLYIVYPAIVAFSVIFLTLGLRNFRRKVLA